MSKDTIFVAIMIILGFLVGFGYGYKAGASSRKAQDDK